jgi:hypothetical protein
MADFHKVPVDLFNRIYDYIGTGDPTTPLPNAAVGSLYRKLDGVSGSTLWQKTASGWEALQGSSFTQATADARYLQLTGGNLTGALGVNSGAYRGDLTAQIVSLMQGNTLLYGHSNPDYTNAIGSQNSSGFPYSAFATYQSTGDAWKRSGSTTYPASWIYSTTSGFLGFYNNAALGTANAAVTLANIFGIDRSGNVNLNGFLKIGVGFNGGLASEVSASVFEFGANDDSSNRFGGSYTIANQGGLFRIDLRAGQPLWTFYGRTAASSSLNSIVTIDSTGGMVTTGTLTLSIPNPTYRGMVISATTGTNGSGISLESTGGRFFVGRDNSAGSGVGAGAYNSYVWDESNHAVVFGVNNIMAGSFNTTGVFTVNAAGVISLNPNSGTSGAYLTFINTGGSQYIGVDNSGGSSFGSGSAYAFSCYVQGGLAWWINKTTAAMTVVQTLTASDFILSSDIRLKEKFQPLFNPLDSLEKLSGFSFQYKADTTRRRVGVSAQEVQEVLPEAVVENADGSLLVSYDSLIPLLIEAVKALRKEVRHGVTN